MADDSPLATAWRRVRDEVRASAGALREDGATVHTALSDHGTVRPGSDPVTFSFTVDDETATGLADLPLADTDLRTTVQYLDADGHRFVVLECRPPDDDLVVFVAGGVRLEALEEHDDDPDQPARTVVRGVDGREVLTLTHERLAPFLAEI